MKCAIRTEVAKRCSRAGCSSIARARGLCKNTHSRNLHRRRMRQHCTLKRPLWGIRRRKTMQTTGLFITLSKNNYAGDITGHQVVRKAARVCPPRQDIAYATAWPTE
ncbi:hypothetical protein JG688_00017520 [Phytophthora aleatoria]|uniref:Uncharacterized protein n=1 Tax=Phytophthora aleatoria TaxID=2496075 RepID=A0A8J5M199_9STRA|nr:hypothetical protein JG688_00017520 [Phytophthora aleatoria]